MAGNDQSTFIACYVSVLVNGSPSREFPMKRGPFLFLIASEGLNILRNEAMGSVIYSALEIGNPTVALSHLQYADDVILFGPWQLKNVSILLQFCQLF